MKKYPSKFYVCVISILTITICSSFIIEKSNKVLIIGIDGCRPDAILKANTHYIDSLWQNGAYSFDAKTDDISSSGICWTGMLTGVWHDKHNVLTNQYKKPNIVAYPHFFNRIKKFDSELKTYSIVHWSPLHKILQEGDVDVIKDFNTDKEVADEVVRLISTADIDAMFVHLDDVDHAGHSYGYHPNNEKYINSIENTDRKVGRILNALKERENYENENWLILMSTDHGGSEFSHGKNIKEHTTIFFLASGQDVKGGQINEQVNVIDVAVTAMKHLGVSIKEEWNLDGKSVGLKVQ